MRLRPAEIGEHAVAHELGDVTLETGDLARHGALVGAQDLPHLFGVEPLRQRGRAHQVTEQHRELPPLGVWSHPRGCSLGRLMRQRVPFGCLGLAPQGGDGIEQPATMADQGNAEVLEVVAGQIGQEIDVDLVVAERLLVALEPEALVTSRPFLPVDATCCWHGLAAPVGARAAP